MATIEEELVPTTFLADEEKRKREEEREQMMNRLALERITTRLNPNLWWPGKHDPKRAR
jgi:hypothetical protein